MGGCGFNSACRLVLSACFDDLPSVFCDSNYMVRNGCSHMLDPTYPYSTKYAPLVVWISPTTTIPTEMCGFHYLVVVCHYEGRLVLPHSSTFENSPFSSFYYSTKPPLWKIRCNIL